MSIEPFGDEALLITLGQALDPRINRRVHALAARVRRDAAGGRGPWGTPVAGHASLLVPYDPARASPAQATERLARLLDTAWEEGLEEPRPGRLIELSVRYGGDAGPDLLAVADRTGLTRAQVVEVHASVEYDVFLLGFTPGFAYLGILLRHPLVLSRREEPRTRVPAGSVAIAGEQTAVYPGATPGGWHLIGRTDAVMWDAQRDPPALLAPGDHVRFVPLAP